MHRAFTRGLTIMKRHLLALCAGTALTLASVISIARGEDATAGAVLRHYGDMAEAMYGDAHVASLDLGKAIDALIASPTNETLAAARKAWKEARPWYQQSEAYRFGNKIVDDWEGRVNSWPLDEGLIDYVSGSYGTDSPENELYAADVIANTSLTIGGKKLNTSKITKELLADTLQEAGGVEA